MVRFLLQILDTEPDYVILYQGYADVRSYLSENFKSDYSHSRTNLLELYPKLKFSTSEALEYFPGTHSVHVEAPALVPVSVIEPA